MTSLSVIILITGFGLVSEYPLGVEKMSKNVLITAGGTVEAIDRVRSITNTGTGKLGSLIADSLAGNEEVEKIFYVHAENSYIPETDKAISVTVGGTGELEAEIRRLCTEEKIDAVVHSMAVSDYRVRSVLRLDDVQGLDREEITEKFDGDNLLKKYNKLPSSLENPIILLEQTPKILPMFRRLLPEAMIIGFKLLDNVTHGELINTAYKLLIANECDYVLANDYVSVKSGCHEGFLIDRQKHEKRCIGKEEIAEIIAGVIINGGAL